MGDKSKIEWTDATWNPVTGCTKVSAGCKFCYAEREFPRVYPGRKFSDIRLHPDRVDQPLRWKRPRKIFVNSMSDLFHEDVPFEFVDRVLAVTTVTDHTFQVLTKRPARMLEYFKDLAGCALRLGKCAGEILLKDLCKCTPQMGVKIERTTPLKFPIPNLWLGVSIENQPTADERIPILLEIPAAVRFVSEEPSLGQINRSRFLTTGKLHWWIWGGESGPEARPSHPSSARAARDECQAASVAFFLKQWGEWLHESQFSSDKQRDRGLRSIRQEAGDGFQFVRVTKNIAGRLLDGREWNEFPEAR